MKKIGTTITEFIAVSTVLSFATFSTIENIPGYENFEDKIIQNISSENINKRNTIIKDISQTLRKALKVCPIDYEIVIPTQSTITHVFNGLNSIAFLISDSNNKYKGIVYSVIPEYEWYGSGSETVDQKFLLIQTVIDDPSLNNLKEESLFDWSAGKSDIMAKGLKPALFNKLEYSAFIISPNQDKIDFSLVAKQDGLYFPSYYGEKEVNDTKYISSVILENKKLN